MDTTEGDMKMDFGHLESPDLTVTLDYDTAKAILVEGNPQAGMQAFMAGKIKVAGRHDQAHGDVRRVRPIRSPPRWPPRSRTSPSRSGRKATTIPTALTPAPTP
jgi:hypothetical protein